MQIFSFYYLRNDADNTIIVDIHFQQSTMVKYRTSVVFGWLDLMGSICKSDSFIRSSICYNVFYSCFRWNSWIIFGLLSVAELAFYIMIGLTELSWTKFLFCKWNRLGKKDSKTKSKNRSQNRFK